MSQPVFGPTGTPAPKPPLPSMQSAWRPLVVRELVRVGAFDRTILPSLERLPGKFIYIPAEWVSQAPAYWRRCPSDPGMVEVSCIWLAADDALQSATFRVPAWLNSDDEFEAWNSNPDANLSPETLSSIGFSLSFAWRTPGVKQWHRLRPGIDLERARSYFERAAVAGYWVAINNLGVMYRDGIGVEPDPAKAFELFERAAQSLDVTPLRHLATCYRDGIGCIPDPEAHTFLEELIKVREVEVVSSAGLTGMMRK